MNTTVLARRLTCALLPALLYCHLGQAQSVNWATQRPVPDWIWDAKGSTDGQQIHLRHSFSIDSPLKAAKLYTTCDNGMTLWINGKEVATSDGWETPIRDAVKPLLRQGINTLAVAAKNEGGVAAFVFKLSIELENGTKTNVLSDTTWKMTRRTPQESWHAVAFDDSGWTDPVVAIRKLGGAPWRVPSGIRRPGGVTPGEAISVPDGFVVDHLYTVPNGEQGSWVSLANGEDGQLIACDQGDKGAFFVTIVESAEGPEVKVAPLEVLTPGSNRRLSGAQGLLWDDGKLWFHRNGGHLYRVIDSDQDGKLDLAEEIPSQTGGGEHGNHAVILAEDNETLYLDGGNHAPLATLAGSRVQSWQEDLLLPRMWDANGHARGKLAPGGWVTRLNRQSLQQELICIGFRNQYDITLNRHGDLFTYDADMEWDLGSPWYRPTRICQVVSGGDYGWRSGTGKWPSYYEDSLPPVVDIGPGSPTGIISGQGSSFPGKYQDALFALDWTFGTIYAIHLHPEGAGYRGASEAFVTGTPLPVTDAVVGTDGALYFTVGGRGTQSALYRVRYTGSESTQAPTSPLAADVAAARAKRTELETFHGKSMEGQEASAAIDTAWPSLSSEDRFLRAAARVALESQPTDLWDTRILAETEPQALITGAVALARAGTPEHQEPLLSALAKLDPDELSDSLLLGYLRAHALVFLRLAPPSPQQQTALEGRLDALLPHANDDVNTELVRLLVYLESPHVIDKAVGLIRNRKPPAIPDWFELASRNAGYGGTVRKVLENHPPSREIGYALMLRNVKTGWTLEQRRQIFQFLNEAAKGSGGASFPGFLRNIREEMLADCSDEQRLALQDVTGEDYDPAPDFEILPVIGPGRTWTTDEALSQSANRFREADFEKGRSLYFAANCGKCHRFAGLGGSIGPDLTTIPRKFDVRYLVEHIIEPSKVISDQYQSKILVTTDGRTLTGLVSEADGKVIVYPPDPKAEAIELDVDDVEASRPSDVSQMPKGLIDGLSREELRDLLAYLMSGGDPKNRKVYGR